MATDPVLHISFRSLAFELLGIACLPLPRTNWHLEEGQDGYDDPYLTDEDYQTLCNMVCEHVPGMTVQAWRDSTLGQRVAFLRTALEKQVRRVSETKDVAFLHTAAHDLLAFLGALKRLVIGYCDDLACDDPMRRNQRLAASEKVIGEWRVKGGRMVASLRERLRHIPVRRSKPVMINDRSRKSATTWLVELADLACTLIVHNERWLEEIDVCCRPLAMELSIDFERLWAEIGIELTSECAQRQPSMSEEHPYLQSLRARDQSKAEQQAADDRLRKVREPLVAAIRLVDERLLSLQGHEKPPKETCDNAATGLFEAFQAIRTWFQKAGKSGMLETLQRATPEVSERRCLLDAICNELPAEEISKVLLLGDRRKLHLDWQNQVVDFWNPLVGHEAITMSVPPPTGVAAVQEAIKQEKIVLQLLDNARNASGIDWQGGVDGLWKLWRGELQEPPPPRPEVCATYQQAADAVDALQRELNHISATTVAPPNEMEPAMSVVTKTVLELDLVGYSTIAATLEDGLGVEISSQLNQQIQGFVDRGLKAVGLLRNATVLQTTGDGAILVFDEPSVAHSFAEAVQEATRTHNAGKPPGIGKRVFRIGIATGEVAMEPKEGGFDIAGMSIARAVRMEAKAKPGEVLCDANTFAGLTAEQQKRYSGVETISGKRDEKFEARRCGLNPDGLKDAEFFTGLVTASHTASPPKPDPTTQTNLVNRREVLSLFTQLKPTQYDQLIFLVEVPINRRPSEALDMVQRHNALMKWADEESELDNLLSVLRELVGPGDASPSR